MRSALVPGTEVGTAVGSQAPTAGARGGLPGAGRARGRGGRAGRLPGFGAWSSRGSFAL